MTLSSRESSETATTASHETREEKWTGTIDYSILMSGW